jgi:hypothetical protein
VPPSRDNITSALVGQIRWCSPLAEQAAQDTDGSCARYLWKVCLARAAKISAFAAPSAE